MTWHLKDRLLEKQLTKIVPNLSNLIEKALEEQPCESYVGLQFNRVVDGRILEDCRLWFYKWELEEIKNYAPNNWNEYPAVKPPENTIFRVEIETDEDFTRCLGRTKDSQILFIYESYEGWINVDSFKEDKRKIIRFRPWED